MSEKTLKRGDRVTLRGTVTAVIEKTQHPGYALVELERPVGIANRDGSGARSATVQVELPERRDG